MDDAELLLPESRPSDVLRSPGILWLLAFMVINCVAFGVALSVHPAGFDECEIAATSGERAAITAVGIMAVGVPTALALWKLRRWALVAALVCVGTAGMAWFILASTNPNCAPPA